MDVQPYLARIGIHQRQSPTLEFLAILQNQHMLSIPFENLDVIAEVPIILTEERLFSKIIDNHRGGFCFELNGMFGWLLRELGYNVMMSEAAVHLRNKGTYSNMRDHQVLLVNIYGNKQYLVDVGFGDSFRDPILMPNGTTEDISGKYRIRLNSSLGESYFLEVTEDGSWIPKYKFNIKNLELRDYQKNCNWLQTSPDSHFTQSNFITIAKHDGRITLSESHLVETKGNEKIKTEFEETRDFTDYYNDMFRKKD